jgi:hypothetical protein
MGKVLVPTGKAEVDKSVFPAKSSWRAGDAARLVSFQILSGGSQCRVLLIENQDVLRSSEANLKEGHGPVRSSVVNNLIAVVALVALLDSAVCGENDFVVL